MAQNNDIERPIPRYTRTDFTSLRAWLSGLPVDRIAGLYFTEDDLEAMGCETPAALQRRLEVMRDHLVERASVRSPHLAEGLRNARKSARWSKVAMNYLFEAAEFAPGKPMPTDGLSAWFKPRVARTLEGEGLRTLADLVQLIEIRGPGWWRPIPRLGRGKASSIERWLTIHEKTLGAVSLAGEPISEVPIVLRPEHQILVPLERMALAVELDGSQGINRAPSFSLIQAHNDLEAVQAYLVKYRAQEKTRRAYQKEIERFLLWCIYKAGKPMSSILADDCERYKAFIEDPDPLWCGKKAKRFSVFWRPFEGKLSGPSRRYVVTILKAFFKWLVDVRYLAGNPWVAVGNPTVETRQASLRIEKALPEDLWSRFSREGGTLDQACMVCEAGHREQNRIVRAALLLMGHTGLRREEVASARRENLKPVPGKADLWELDVLGKRRKWRTVFLPSRVVDALEDHWEDRGEDFKDGQGALVSPVVIPMTPTAMAKHFDDNVEGAGFSADGLYRCIKTGLERIADNRLLDLEDHERDILRKSGLHDFRHTFGTVAAGKDLPLDVLQRLLGHASLQTTSIYVQAERKRSIEEMAKFFG